MKRKKVIFITALSLFITSVFSGCKNESLSPNEFPEMSVYRLASTRIKESVDIDRLFVPETLKIDEDETPVQAVMNTLNTSPTSSDIKNLYPTGVRILSANLQGGVVRVQMNDNYLILMGIDQNLADYGMCLSFCSLPGVNSIDIYSSGSRIRTNLKPSDLVLSNNVISDNEGELRLYFPKSDGSGLECEYRHANLSVDDSAERCIMDALLSGPKSEGLSPIAGQDTFLSSIYTLDGVCSVNFSKGFLEDPELSEEEISLVLDSIESSLLVLSNVESVLIYSDGKAVNVDPQNSIPLE